MSKLEPSETSRAPGRLRWVLGWVAIPATLVLLLFLAGVHVGARHPGMWLSRFMMWLFT
jgi:hypothetical protein